MPFVKIEILRGRSKDFKKQLLQTIHEALAISLNIPEWDRIQRLYELDESCFEYHPKCSKQFCLIELVMYPGRTKEIKSLAIGTITQLLNERLAIPTSDIFIVMHEPPFNNWGFGGIQKEEGITIDH